MKLPSITAAWPNSVRFGLYLTRRLRAALQSDLTDAARAITVTVRDSGRRWEDTDFAVQEAIADRDAADLALDGLVREVRRKLIGRSAHAEKEAPYTLIVPDGVGWYTNAPVAEELVRYRQLRDRLTTHLAPGDDLIVDLLPRLDAALDRYARDEETLSDARNAAVRERDALEHSLGLWREEMERTYGALMQRFGRADAEAFFPAVRPRGEAAVEKSG